MVAKENSTLFEKVTVIIATAGQRNRIESLERAVRSVLDQESVSVKIILVFNGPNVITELPDRYKLMPGVDVKMLEKPGLPNALNYGRSCVKSEYFGFLDDDDVYLPGALKKRCQVLDANQNIDVVATNGFIQSNGRRKNLLPNALAVENAPMEELFRQNWLSSCGGLFRTSSVAERYFRVDSTYYEWTMTAFLLSFDRRIAYLSEPTFVINETEGSLSASVKYLEAYPEILKFMLSFDVSQSIRKVIKQRLTDAYHALSVHYLGEGKAVKAWRFHLKSMQSIHGLKYLAYSRKFLT